MIAKGKPPSGQASPSKSKTSQGSSNHVAKDVQDNDEDSENENGVN